MDSESANSTSPDGNAARAKGQSDRLQIQHEQAGGPRGIFGEEAKLHDHNVGEVMKEIAGKLKRDHPKLSFRHRLKVSKKEINERLSAIDSSLGQVLFVENSFVKPDGGIIEVLDCRDRYRIVLVSESKHQGNDVEKIRKGIMQGRNKDQDIMTAGNAIERVHKNIQEVRNLMLNELHFPYVVFLQGSNFATTTFCVETPEGRKVEIAHDVGTLNRIDRVTASSFGMKINNNYCQNIFVELDGKKQMLQAASLYFQSEQWAAKEMMEILWEVATTSLKILCTSLPK